MWSFHIMPVLGARRSNEVSAEKILRFVADLCGHLKPKSVNNILSSLNSALAMAATSDRGGPMIQFAINHRSPYR
jgi:hypothetical protein